MPTPSFTQYLNESLNESLSDYLSAIKKHDWYYMMSDDDRVYRQAQTEISKIKQLYAELPEKNKTEAFRAFNAMKKENFPNANDLDQKKFDGYHG